MLSLLVVGGRWCSKIQLWFYILSGNGPLCSSATQQCNTSSGWLMGTAISFSSVYNDFMLSLALLGLSGHWGNSFLLLPCVHAARQQQCSRSSPNLCWSKNKGEEEAWEGEYFTCWETFTGSLSRLLDKIVILCWFWTFLHRLLFCGSVLLLRHKVVRKWLNQIVASCLLWLRMVVGGCEFTNI